MPLDEQLIEVFKALFPAYNGGVGGNEVLGRLLCCTARGIHLIEKLR